MEELRLAATSNRDLGDKFERLIAAYLKTDPLYQDKYSDVWLWGKWPDRGRVRKMIFGKKDGKPDKSVIVYNSHTTLTGIPLEVPLAALRLQMREK